MTFGRREREQNQSLAFVLMLHRVQALSRIAIHAPRHPLQRVS
jgi:hypothetical protein